MGNQSDTEGGGSLWTYDPESVETQCFINPIDEAQLIRGVASRNGVSYLGGGGPDLLDGGTIVAFDHVAGRELWRLDVQSSGTAAMAMQGQNLYSLSRGGVLSIIDV